MNDDYNYNRRVSESALKNWIYDPNEEFLYIDDSDNDIEDEIVMNDLSWNSDMLFGKTPPNISPLDDREIVYNVCSLLYNKIKIMLLTYMYILYSPILLIILENKI